MSVTIDSALLTGTDPSQHHVPGLVWYSEKEKRLINYGTGPIEVVKYGIDPLLWNALLHLNSEHLSDEIPTIFEELADKGMTSGSINGLIYRGKTEHTLAIPDWLTVATTLPSELKVKGPQFMSLGALSDPLKGVVELPGGITERLGLNDKFSIETAAYLIEHDLLPDFLYVYMPDMDQKLHKAGPSEIDGLREVDRSLNTLLQAFGSREEALQKAVIIVMGDSGVTQMVSRSENPTIHLGELLSNFSLMDPGGTANEHIDLVLALNEAMGYAYKMTAQFTWQEIAKILLADTRIDFVAWKDEEWINVLQGEEGRAFQYKAKGDITDSYGQTWTIKGDAEVLKLQLNDNQLRYTDYPDGLQRLSAALHSHAGDFLVITAKPGYELAFGGSPTHAGGGGHGSLYKTDSLIPVIINGTEQAPMNRRIIDIKPYVMKLLSKERALHTNDNDRK